MLCVVNGWGGASAFSDVTPPEHQIQGLIQTN